MSKSHAMNLKLNNDVRGSTNVLDTDSSPKRKKKTPNAIKEERRRNGRYVAILVGIMLFLLAIYHAWIRRIPIVASLVVPALIMFIYVGWVLYTASRDKHRLLDAEAALQAEQQAEMDALNGSQNNLEVSLVTSRETSKIPSQELQKECDETSSTHFKEVAKEDKTFVKPVILINDRPPENLEQNWDNAVETLLNFDKLKGFQTRRKYKRKFCRSKRHAVFKRSYSIA